VSDLPEEDGRTPRQRERTAYHEASHAAASWLLRGRVGLVSIEPNAAAHGFAQVGGRRLAAKLVNQIDRSLPAVAWPADARRTYEVDLISALAGPEGERALAPPRESPLDLEPVSRYADDLQAAAADVRQLTACEQRFLHDWKGESRDDRRKSDEEFAAGAANLLAGKEAQTLLDYYRAVVGRLVLTARFRRLVEALVPELLAHRSVSGRRVREIFQEAESGNGLEA
jgi:hypothetical protein